ncbi:hypothetical protein COU95_03070, partial [Candidatus Shapirobacteria bacterium CG10_big_fil_rev_8_21_14_0_10_40_9]
EGIFYPGKQGEEEIFPQIGDLSLARLTLENVSSEADQKNQEYKEWTAPLNFLLRPGTQMTIVGLLNEPRPGAEVTVDKEAPGGELNYTLVAFTDYLRASEESGVPRHYFAVIPTHFPGDPENKKALTLTNLLEANGCSYQDNQIYLEEKEEKIVLEMNQIEGEELIKAIDKACGLCFVDQIGGELIKNPVVPYPEEMPKYWIVDEVKDEEGNISLVLQGKEELGDDFKEIAQARYDEEKGEWRWEKIEAEPLLELSEAPKVEGLKAYLEDDKIVYRAETANLYGLKEGDYAGEIVSYTLNQKRENGVGLIPPVLEILLKGYQPESPYDVKEEKIPLPFDPRGLEFGVGEIKYAREVTGPDGKKFEMRIGFLGLDLPVGTTICCPVGVNPKGIEVVSWYDRDTQIFSSKEKEETLSQKCLSEGFCTIKEYVSRGELVRVVYERPKTLKIQPEDKKAFPFSIMFPWDSQIARDIFAEIDRDPDKEGERPKKQVSLGDPLFVLDSNKPAVQFVFPSNYPIVLGGRRAVTGLDSLFKIDNRYVFILPSS